MSKYNISYGFFMFPYLNKDLKTINQKISMVFDL